jgi:D-threo-aldose 1-dehydrogenase
LTTRAGGTLAFTELGLGTAPLGNIYAPIAEPVVQATMEAAWDTGVRYFDTAPQYGLGLAETRLNRFLRGRPRDAYVLSTKVGRLLQVCPPEEREGATKFVDCPSRRIIYDYSYDGVLRSIDYSFERLGVDRIDILFCHDVDVWTHGTKEASDRRIAEFMSGGYKALHRLREEGVIAAFGAGLNEWQVCERLAREGEFDLFLLAGRYTLLEQEALETFLPLCEEKGIRIVLGGPYNSGILATGVKSGRANYNYKPAPPEILDRVARIERICEAHGVKLAEAALRFPLSHPAVLAVIPGAVTPEEAQTNADILGARIPPALWADLKAERLIRDDAPVPT